MGNEHMDFHMVFFKEFKEEFRSTIEGGFGILAKKCIYACDVEKSSITTKHLTKDIF
jgi:hypothetical protein